MNKFRELEEINDLVTNDESLTPLELKILFLYVGEYEKACFNSKNLIRKKIVDKYNLNCDNNNVTNRRQ